MADVVDGYVVWYLRETETRLIPGNLLPCSLAGLKTKGKEALIAVVTYMHAHKEEPRSLGMNAL